MKNSTIVLISLLFLTSCTSVGDIKEHPPIMNDVVGGNYADIARCVVSGMESDSRWTINSLNYDVRVYSDNKTSEVIASAHSPYTGKIVAFRLFSKQINKNETHVDLRGKGSDAKIALKYVKSCVK
jgi:hypothetical protein